MTATIRFVYSNLQMCSLLGFDFTVSSLELLDGDKVAAKANDGDASPDEAHGQGSGLGWRPGGDIGHVGGVPCWNGGWKHRCCDIWRGHSRR